MRLHFCGVRGSTPAPGPDFVRYGGHTSCVALAHDGVPPTVILDAGTGIRRVTGLLDSRWTFQGAPGRLAGGGFTIEAREIPHKGGTTLGYRVSDGRSAVAYITDHGPTALGPGPEGWGEYHQGALELAAGADVLIHDAQLLAEEVPAQAAFGHAAAEYAIELACRAGARRVVLFHHQPDRTDDELDKISQRFAGAPMPVTVATEGQVIDL